MEERKKLITYALPYANGPLHLGHALGFTQVDCYVRALRLKGKDVLFVCGDDAHGTPIMLNAEKQGKTPKALIDQIYTEHKRDVQALGVALDHYHTTDCQLNEDIVHAVYHRLEAKELIAKRSVEQAYDESLNMFLPDRYVRGECPKCGAKDQYGDHCEVCGKTYDIATLVSPQSVMSGQTPVWRKSDHYFYRLSETQPVIENWLETAKVQTGVKNKLSEWFGGLQDWDISRDKPYFGIRIPNTEDKYFYVWLDAPFGYLSAFGDYLNLQDPEAVFSRWAEYEISHFIGKDIIYFHGVFWPSVLEASGIRQPSSLYVHGFLNIDGEKMSKSRGTFVLLADYLEKLPSDMLRYYFASRLSQGVLDVDLNWQDFKQKINADLVGKLVNIGNRTQGFLHKFYQGKMGDTVDTVFWEKLISRQSIIEDAYEKVDLAQVCREVMELCDLTNQYIDQHKPWEIAKTEERENLLEVVSTSLNAFRYLSALLAPIIPDLALKISNHFDQAVSWDSNPLLNHPCERFPHLLKRVEDDQIDFS